MKKTLLAVLLGCLALTGCGNDGSSSTMGAGWVTLPNGRGIVMCASVNGYGISCDWDHAERTAK